MAAIKFLCLFALIPLISCRQINFLPFEQVEAYLNNDPSSDYEVVSLVHTLHKRSLPSTIRIRAFQEDIDLYLEPNENYLLGSNTPVYLAYGGLGGRTTFKSISHDKLALYHDLKNRAALVVEEKGEKHLMYGIIGDYMIRPLTEEKQSSMRNKRSTNTKNILTVRDNEIFADDHILIKINQPKEDHIDEPQTLNRNVRSIWEPISSFRKNSDDTKQNRLYPEILVYADYNYFKKSGGDVKEFIKYQAVFWNGVDLLYRYFDNPEIRLNIAGIVISQESSADIYPKKYVRGNQLSIEEFVISFQYEIPYRSIYDESFPKISYDIVIALTNYELVDDFSTVDTNGTTFGIASIGGACTDGGIAVVRDLLTFHGVSYAVHEIGHLFGAYHDMSPKCQKLVPVADYMMSYNSVSENQFRWSACSLKYMSDFLKSSQAECLKNKPVAITSPYKKFLPGKIADIDAQCDRILPGSNPVINEGVSVCHHLVCEKVTPEQIDDMVKVHTARRSFKRGALEGSTCENGGMCIQGDCIMLQLWG